ncbi:hypothetical protein BJ546DRAFT_567369 [Cryomyces antarcticus]
MSSCRRSAELHQKLHEDLYGLMLYQTFRAKDMMLARRKCSIVDNIIRLGTSFSWGEKLAPGIVGLTIGRIELQPLSLSPSYSTQPPQAQLRITRVNPRRRILCQHFIRQHPTVPKQNPPEHDSSTKLCGIRLAALEPTTHVRAVLCYSMTASTPENSRHHSPPVFTVSLLPPITAQNQIITNLG